VSCENWDTIGFPATQTAVSHAPPDNFMHFPLRDEPQIKEPASEPIAKAKKVPVTSWDRLVAERKRYG
jgi:hypothetical protein